MYANIKTNIKVLNECMVSRVHNEREGECPTPYTPV